MKKNLFVLFLILVLCLTVFVSCNQGNSEENKKSESTAPDEKTEIESAFEGEVSVSSEGLEFTSNGDGTCYVSGMSPDADIHIVIPSYSPDGDAVTGIGKNAFKKQHIASVVIPNSVTEIGTSAFYDCMSLHSVDMPDSLVSIGTSAFYGCRSLQSVEIPDSVTKINNSAFYGCRSLQSVEIPDSVTKIENFAFCDCHNITSVEIGNGVTKIGENAFSGCYKLIEVYNRSGLTIEAGSISNGCVGEYAKKIYTTSIYSKLCEKDGYIFFVDEASNEYYLMGYNGKQVNLVLPEGINDHEYLIYRYAFANCYSLENVVIDDSVTGIGQSAFSGCKSLESVKIGNGVKSIDSYAFSGCDSLNSLEIGADVTSMGEKVFFDCISITSLKIPMSLISYIPKTNLESVVITTGEGIEDSAFANCSSLKSIVIPDSVKSIAGNAFNGCYCIDSVYYMGSEEDWARMAIFTADSPLKFAKIIYNYIPRE